MQNNIGKIKYFKTMKIPVVDKYFGNEVIDNYRWLEDDLSDDTAKWVKAQNELTFNYLDKISYRDDIKEQISKLWNFEERSIPFVEGDYTYFFKNDGLQNQSILYRISKNGSEEIFLDPNKFSEDGTVSLGEISFTEDGSLVAYSISEGGSDWRKIIVLKTEDKSIVGETLIDIKFSNISWKGNDGFFYSSYDKPIGSELSAKTDQHKLYYHKLGTSQKDDELIFGGIDTQKHRYVSGIVTKNCKYLLISASKSTSGNKLFIKDLEKENSDLIEITKDYENDTYLIDSNEDKLYLLTNFNAPNNKLVVVSAKNPSCENWKDLICETENVLGVSVGSGYIFANYTVDAVSKIKQYDYNGNYICEIILPGIGSVYGFNGKIEAEKLYYYFQNYNTPTSIYEYNVKNKESKLCWKPEIDFNSNDYESKQVFYESKDKTKIPMIITYKKGIKLDGNNPTILYGYGGFNISLTPVFNIINAVWLNNGGICAVANLRGGGEYGKKWHEAGIKFNKQNVFDDFISAAEYLINEKYTSKDYLAIKGGSNGGLLVGVTLLQRPDLFKVALPAVGVLDMLRYHKFTAGAGWAYDYGTSEESIEMFKYLKSYSPVHNVVDGVEYPAVLITTGDHDDRVVPAHSFKFAAELQEKQKGENPVLIRIETNAGHGAGTPASKIIQTNADIFAFTLWNMGIKEL
ncbi:prolyl oligopeptidase family serine peptidase [Oceanivirga salmonicida]|uniref:prolyl oligopeptidase family serine peptidase n=1 Tax=Oceanivirga salmonicida TaxID=1769291 RepID=UPI0012E1F0D3|nr:prolyl oligopeptidase family serine peptidase [Oceanivirga salmonicida]